MPEFSRKNSSLAGWPSIGPDCTKPVAGTAVRQIGSSSTPFERDRSVGAGRGQGAPSVG